MCMNNGRQLMFAWLQYATENNDRVVGNFGVQETYTEIAATDASKNYPYRTWACNNMNWNVETQVTNLALIRLAALGSYTANNVDIYRCPADMFLSPLQRLQGWKARARSISMNAYFGPYNPTWTSTKNTFFPNYRQFLTLANTPNPSNLYVMMDEHPDSINDGFFLNNADVPSLAQWGDLPASYHCGAAGFSFADGHSEIHKWKSYRCTILPVRLSPGFQAFPFSSDANAKKDSEWITSRTSVKN